MHLTLRQLKVFEAVARHLSFTRAAEELHLSQPAASMQIKQLEESIGLPLFEQLGKRIFLTSAGQEVHRYAKAIQQNLDELAEIVDEIKGLQRGTLTVSVATTAKYFAPVLLARFCHGHPGIKINLKVTNREVLLAQLAANEMDMAIMGQPPSELDVDAVSFLENRLVVIAPPDHMLAGEAAVPLPRLLQENFIVREQGSGTRIAIERFFASHGLRLSASMEMETSEAIKQAVQAGMGLGIVSAHTVALELETERLCLLDAVGFPIMRYWYVVHPRGKRLSTVAQAFKDFLLEEAAQLL